MAVIDTIADLVSQALGFKRIYDNATSPSLTAYTKQSNVMSRLYIEDSILRDDICPPLVGVLNQLYVSYILSALNLDTMCANGRTVREQFEVVATENKDIIEDIIKTFGTVPKPSMEAGPVVDTEPATQRLPTTRVIELTMNGINVLKEEAITKKTTEFGSTTTTDKEGEKHGFDQVGRVSSGEETKGKDTLKKTGKDEEWGTNDKTSQSTYQFKAYIYVQLIPYVLLPEVVDGYIGANFSPPLSVRWKQLKAGEISFWKDFIFALDLIKKQAKALKKDKHNILGDMLNRQHSALLKWWIDICGILSSNRGSHNTANTILITNKATFDRACRENRINFQNKTQRQRFFNKTWSMIICVVDPLYNTVEMYFNGVDMKGTYTFNMINKVGAKGQDNFDLKDVMSAFSQGLSPKF